MSEQTKKCSKCGEVKATTEFYKDKSKKDGRTSRCRVCRSLEAAKYRAENPENVKMAQAKWCAENRDKRKAYYAKYRAENLEKEKARSAKYQKANLDRFRAYEQRRRARKANALGDHTAEQLQARFDYHGNKCVYCDSTENLHADHQIPLSRGGTNFASNMVPACASCNLSKNDKTPIEFADYTFKQLQAMLGK